ncbi:sulfatase-like protein [Phytophthora infestans T30-4]|uniref:Sulfatase-like protein n=1 Tax=Phytophthora infestans (strain T30-4) TaxID=403677 RepID=D0N978_PHYIT|nr:sulfatase-like protein [Phytophthora infestans T30-4]EEY54366.1 sulfatase-like protein [Phytophthora infestans T30-4]|eukprot:XP_002904188.1 sulfatase-like protein [Phytophthora infestans T30-4]
MLRSHLSHWLRITVYLRVNRWTDWALLATAILGYGVVIRLWTLPVVLDKWANAWQQTWWVALLGLLLGAMEDLCVCVVMLTVLWTFDYLTLKSPARRRKLAHRRRETRKAALAAQNADVEQGLQSYTDDTAAPAWTEAVVLTEQFGRLTVYAVVFLLATGGLCLDSVFLRARKMRFSADFVAMYFREWDAAGELEIDAAEWWVLFWTLLLTVGLALFVGLLGACWINLLDWNVLGNYERLHSDKNDDDDSSGDSDDSDESDDDDDDDCSCLRDVSCRLTPRGVLLLLVVALFLATYKLATTLPTVVGLIALNPVLSEPIRLSAGVQFVAERTSNSISNRPMSTFIEQETELSQIFDDDSLYRRTLAFDGPLAFDIKVGRDERPNVLLLVMESFRMQDSRFLLDSALEQEVEAATSSLLPPNVTLTPNFDRWASRGVALRNLWSTWRTSRSIETLLFGQMPYDSVTETGTTSGRLDTNLTGLPQLFKAKGYDTIFTTGTRTDYDYWDTFLPAHGFDTVLDRWGLVDIVENDLNLNDWSQGNHMLTYWGIHDDLSYTALSYIIRSRQFAQNVAKQQAERDAAAAKRKTPSNETEKPLPITTASTNPWFATHYTISSHVPFNERPDWFFRYVTEHRAEMEEFAPLYRGHEHEELIRDYVQMRYFSDMVFGRFMEQLEKDNVLKDTIVVVVGDHGQAPERGSATPEQDQIATSRIAGAIIAEGRIQTPVVIDDAASQSDILNTLADIVGLPVGGLLQTSIGRSLKRKPPKSVGKRVVYSNNPATNLAAVVGDIRLHFFAEGSDAVRAYHTQRDPRQEHDLMGELSGERVRELLRICDDGRALNAYFKLRWDNKCLLRPTCEPRQ